ncbi:MAG: hypothetical protein GYA02_02150 [Clostridiaceae bacterium]|nr:hypothetical protein [Clostridiaceae bacterium]
MHTLYINLKSYKLLVKEYLQYNNYSTVKMKDFIQWVKLKSIKSTNGYLN